MKRLKTFWTPENEELLKSLVANGATVVRAAAALKRNMASVRNQARKLGTPFPPIRQVRKKWADSPSSLWCN